MTERGKTILERAAAFVDRKYVARSDARQKAMGLAYIEAERFDLAKEMARFAMQEMELAPNDGPDLSPGPRFPIIEVIMPWLHERYGDCFELDSAAELVRRLHDAGFSIVPRAHGEEARAKEGK